MGEFHANHYWQRPHLCANEWRYSLLLGGGNSQGQLRNGTTTTSNAPVAVTMPANVSFIAINTGYLYTCAVTMTDTAYCWGYNYFGQLGNGTTTNSNIPVAVPMPTNVLFAAIDAGTNHTCALTTTGTAYCWGYNYYGVIGDGTTTNRTTPVAVTMPNGVSFTAVVTNIGFSNWEYTCALTATQTAYCWGNNGKGQLGNGTNTTRNVTGSGQHSQRCII